MQYVDLVAAKGEAKPGTFEATGKLSIKDGKLQWEDTRVLFDVDPETFKRTPRRDQYPTTTYTEKPARQTSRPKN